MHNNYTENNATITVLYYTCTHLISEVGKSKDAGVMIHFHDDI